MKKGNNHTKTSATRTEAFTLIEILVVLVIVGLLMALAVPSTIGTLQANRLTSAGNTLLFKISQAQQTAVANSYPTEIRFYSYDERGVTAYRAYQLFRLDDATNISTPIDDPTYLGDGHIVLEDNDLSPLLKVSAQGNQGGAWPRDADSEPFKSKNAKYVRIVLHPDNSTNLSIPLRDAYVTLISDQEAGKNSSTAPPNYYTIQIDPVNGRAKSYRP